MSDMLANLINPRLGAFVTCHPASQLIICWESMIYEKQQTGLLAGFLRASALPATCPMSSAD